MIFSKGSIIDIEYVGNIIIKPISLNNFELKILKLENELE
jgi:hypothetical protein